ncbi:hypothetical protein [Labedaea rhizosphaerae]|uniref:Uncharacterized protein n=1 Tax=Labedaea rhizosphaerae TaxID=598644 RepID=A0A4R6SDD2_LABRH|nr:hypothetical protein [Labedaea rhizosphaerae]TDP97633.1 hypothetical protein EV186_103597 [Labedaea rhizosphaerae]
MSEQPKATTKAAGLILKIAAGVLGLVVVIAVIVTIASGSGDKGDQHDVRSYPCHDPDATHQTTLYVDYTARTWHSENGQTHSLDGDERQVFNAFLTACAPNPAPSI